MVVAVKAVQGHDGTGMRFVVHEVTASDATGGASASIKLTNAASGKWVTADGKLTNDGSKAGTFTVTDLGNGKGYSIKVGNSYLSVDGGKVGLGNTAAGFKVWSVT
jgi:hypothetical protein